MPAPDKGRRLHDLRIFGFGLAILLAGLAVLAWRRSSNAAPAELLLAACAGLLGWLRPGALEPVYKPWMKVAGVIGKANTFLVTALVYYLIITPYAIFFRLRGADLLDERLRDRESYWRPKEPCAPEDYQNQF
ncbi:MAG TPA: hypothetical protein DEB40_08755 [Elusimicrobia bacterium]|nr:hypothetical protein [Elusimicrobiota bacterium]HBT61818.1 hypothetical protein [Elusimicrobiota bacterium]